MISAIVLTKNEEERISGCLESLSWCNEIIVIDDNSTDNTRVLAKEFGARVYIRNLGDDFASQRNFGLRKARGEWVLFIDADERVPVDLINEINSEFKNPKAEGYLIKRQDIFMGKKMVGGEWGETWLLRLARAGKGRWRRRVHETWKVAGRVSKMHSPLLHSPSESLSEVLGKINRYSTLHTESNQEEGKKSGLTKIIFMPLLKFIINFIVKSGYKDGVHGFVFATLMSFHSFLAWTKLWVKQELE
ncbi:hypothetical protein A2803_00105 [Candidatus Woesebacteria bacterium RIFCSPHIGHO2_01_FULL_44_21]|uniref:Glycosyltransferase 2-like domain-containing protein n=1 Tax=Candidatus Woesebacteria bacterium RIFCSPHIGHO2_01_FULL_44_21 TaxID=1802503 RepID=A0A1F7Z2D7_9BACT|nr:MAG: hypothetical protein A2803_00105 [Candidatus Woesebacteria bacterium RIFCSPHIGHO2_01_FULL_44_21]OGM71152.1 MAG: hypothetical protein A2897_02960 [Candidatus Woesebacteria bacterium RIFCSPLOWO2_01_FULL_44_24b]